MPVNKTATKNYLIDMDGVLISGQTLIPGAEQFIEKLKARQAKFLVLTNNPLYTPKDLAHNLQRLGLDIPAELIFTSAMATASFLQMQRPNGTAFVIGESGLTSAIHDIGYIITEHDPDYVILGETHAYSLESLTKGIRLILSGARFVATNPDPSGPSADGIVPACGAVAALIEKVTGIAPFFVGKPNPLMVRTALNYLGVHSEDTVIVGDRMDTDIIGGVQNGMESVLVLTGVTRSEDISRYPYIPSHVYDSVAEIEIE
ncbi:MAG TPA: HAD-IIA family hydrolase [Anaerolineales bacterium]|jgi:NagD protein|nr:HAD-IIA family hydrolase [Anaerolineales bacterium]